LVQAERINAHKTGAFYSRLIWLLVALLCGITTARAQPGGPVISEIRIQGNQRVEPDAIKIHISSRAGQPLAAALALLVHGLARTLLRGRGANQAALLAVRDGLVGPRS